MSKLRLRINDIRKARDYHASVKALRELPSLESVTTREYHLQQGLQQTAAQLWSAWLQLLPERIHGEARSVLSQFASVLKMLAGLGANDAGNGQLFAQFYELSEKASPFLSAWESVHHD